jgi:hypothetical protein
VHDQHRFAVQGQDDGVRQDLGTRPSAKGFPEQKISIAVHDETRHPAGCQRADGIEGLRLAGIRRVIAHPGLEQIAEDVQRVGNARLGPQEFDELAGDVRAGGIDVQIRNEENRHPGIKTPASRRARPSG